MESSIASYSTHIVRPAKFLEPISLQSPTKLPLAIFSLAFFIALFSDSFVAFLILVATSIALQFVPGADLCIFSIHFFRSKLFSFSSSTIFVSIGLGEMFLTVLLDI